MAANFVSKRMNLDLRSPASAGFRKGIVLSGGRIVLLALLDAGAIALAHFLAVTLGGVGAGDVIDLGPLMLAIAVKLSVMASNRLYDAGAHRRNYASLVKALTISEALLVLIAIVHSSQQILSFPFVLLSWLFSVGFCSFERLTVDMTTRYLRKHGAVCYPVFLIAETEEQEAALNLLDQEQCYNVLGVAGPAALDRGRRDATFADLKRRQVVEVFVSWSAIQNRMYLCWHFQTAGLTLRILPSDLQSLFPKSEIWLLGGVPSLIVRGPVIVGGDYWLKRCFDIVGSIVLMLLLSPVFLVIASLIKRDSPGPIFFRQERVGLHGKIFKVWKFRTMVSDADKLQKSLEEKNEMKDGVLFKMKDDPRVTAVGRVLRQYSLDEFPQLINVLVGEMSLVGPRPLPRRDVERFKERHLIRQEVLPGMTGLWQVSGRSNIDNFDEAMKLDLKYITDWSIWLDLKILLDTVNVVLNKQGAY